MIPASPPDSAQTDSGHARAFANPRKGAFLAAFRVCGTVAKASRATSIDRDTHYCWLSDDPDYKAEFERAKTVAAEILEEEAVRRAYEGVPEPVFHAGVQCGQIQRYSDRLMIFLLEGYKSGTFRRNVSHELSGPNGGPIEHKGTLDLTKLTDAQILQLEQLAAVAAGEPETATVGQEAAHVEGDAAH